jgi:TolR protein
MAGLMRRKRSSIADINVTPIVDVMLVLLIIFMITAPFMKQGIDVNLPKVKGKTLEEIDKINIVINRDGKIFVNDNEIHKDELLKLLSQYKETNPTVLLRADKDVSYGLVAEVMGEIKASGLEKIGMVTEPKDFK